MRRGTPVIALAAAGFLLVQIGDSTAVPEASAAMLEKQAPFGMAAGTDHEFFLTHTRVIPIGRSSISVPILMYHYIRPAPSIYLDRLGYRLTVTPDDFRAQMDWLSVNGNHPVDFNDLRAYFGGLAPLPSKPLVITFDDGYSDLYTTAYPILKTYHFKAVAYIVTSFVGQSRYVTGEQIVEMDQNGIQIASHTIDHANIGGASLGSATYQLATSKAWLQHLIGHSVIDFAYPSGKFSSSAVYALQSTGYDTAVTELPGTVHSLADRYTWTRIRVGGGESLSDFIYSLGPEEPWVDVTAVTTHQPA